MMELKTNLANQKNVISLLGNKMKEIISGIVLILGGIVIIINPKYYSNLYGMTIDFSSIQYPLASAFIGIGIMILYGNYKRRK